jgi:hypothetical protein
MVSPDSSVTVSVVSAVLLLFPVSVRVRVVSVSAISELSSSRASWSFASGRASLTSSISFFCNNSPSSSDVASDSSGGVIGGPVDADVGLLEPDPDPNPGGGVVGGRLGVGGRNEELISPIPIKKSSEVDQLGQPV